MILNNTRSHWACAFALLLIAVAFSSQAIRVFIAAEYAASANPILWSRATQLQPDNAAYWAKLGSIEVGDLEQNVLERAIADYEKAVRANPHSDRYWLELSELYERLGETSRARAAYDKAQFNHPISPDVSWRHGNFLLRNGDFSAARVQFRKALLVDQELTEGVVAESWKTEQFTSQKLAEILPPQNRYYFKAIDYFLRQNNVDAALETWDGLLATRLHFELPQAIPLVNDAISAGRAKDAQRVWQQGLEVSWWPRDLNGEPQKIFNGGFEHELANGGFDWREQLISGVSYSLDSIVTHSGSRSLRISFDGTSNLDFHHLTQCVLVEPRQRYRFRAYVKSQSLSTDSGIRFAIQDPLHPAAEALTSSITGTQSWMTAELELMTGPDTRLLKVVLRRFPSEKFDNKLTGSVWLDDVSLVAVIDNDRHHHQ